MLTQCGFCQSDIDVKPSRLVIYSNSFCNRTCHVNFQRKTANCPQCDNEMSHKRKFCSRACANTARRGINYTGSNTKNKYARLQRLKKELFEIRGRKCERCPYNNTDIINLHHIKRRCDGGTDEHGNLELLCPNCHAEEHYG